MSIKTNHGTPQAIDGGLIAAPGLDNICVTGWWDIKSLAVNSTWLASYGYNIGVRVHGWGLYVTPAGALTFQGLYKTGAVGTLRAIMSANGFITPGLLHIVALVDRPGLILKLWVNGVPVSVAFSGTLDYLSDVSDYTGTPKPPLLLNSAYASNVLSTNNTVTAASEDFRFYRGSLVPGMAGYGGDEIIKSIANMRGKDGVTKNLVVRWMGSEGNSGKVATGSGIIKDSSVNGNNGTPVGDPTFDVSKIAPIRRY